MAFLKALYVIAIATTLVVFTGYGIDAFYDNGVAYHRNVLMIAYACGVIYLVVNLLCKPKFNLIKIGFLLGGLITIIYAACQGAGQLSDAVIFGYSVMTLLVLFTLAYIQIIPWKPSSTPTKPGEWMPVIKVFWGLATAIFLVLLVSFGVSSFYKETFSAGYHRNVLIITYACGLFYLLLPLALKPRLSIIKHSLNVAALLTILYASSQGAGSLSSTTMFGYVAVSLIVLFLRKYANGIISRNRETLVKSNDLLSLGFVIAASILLVAMVICGILAFYEGHGGSYHRNILIIAYAAGLLYLVPFLMLKPYWNDLKHSFGIAALITIIYSALQGMGNLSDTTVFGYIAVSLLVLFFLGYIKLIPTKEPDTSTKVTGWIPLFQNAFTCAATILLCLLVTYGISAFYKTHGGGYHRNIMIITYASGLLYVLIGLLLKSRFRIMKHSFGIAALIIIIYAALQGLGELSDTAVFGYTAANLILLFSLGYMKLLPQSIPVDSKEKGQWMPSIKVSWVIAAAIVLVLLVAYGIFAFYKNTGSDDYHRNVLFIAYAGAILYIIIGLILKVRFNIFRIGLLLGGLITMILAIIRGFSEASDPLRFMAITFVLILLLILGYIKLVPRIKPAILKKTGKDLDDK